MTDIAGNNRSNHVRIGIPPSRWLQVGCIEVAHGNTTGVFPAGIAHDNWEPHGLLECRVVVVGAKAIPTVVVCAIVRQAGTVDGLQPNPVGVVAGRFAVFDDVARDRWVRCEDGQSVPERWTSSVAEAACPKTRLLAGRRHENGPTLSGDRRAVGVEDNPIGYEAWAADADPGTAGTLADPAQHGLSSDAEQGRRDRDGPLARRRIATRAKTDGSLRRNRRYQSRGIVRYTIANRTERLRRNCGSEQ